MIFTLDRLWQSDWLMHKFPGIVAVHVCKETQALINAGALASQ